MWATLLHGLFVIHIHQAIAMEYRGNTYSVQEPSQEFSSPGDPADYAPFEGGDHPPFLFSGGNGYVQMDRPYMIYPAGDYSSQYIPQTVESSHFYQESMPNIHTYKPNFAGKDYNEYPHILPPGGKSIEQLQQEADLRIKKIYFDSRENHKIIGEKIKKLKDSYGYGTIGYPGYKNSIKYDPIDLGTHNAIDLGSTIGGSRLPVQTVTVTKTLGVKVPQPYPVRQEVPVPAPFPVPVANSHDEDGAHHGREIKQYLDGYGSEFSEKSGFVKPETILGRNIAIQENSSHATIAPSTIPYANFRPSFGAYATPTTPNVHPQAIYRL